jgi:hypothetical protein
MSQNVSSPISVFQTKNLGREQNLIGLNLTEITVVNNCDSGIIINAPEHWFFESKTGDVNIFFSEREMGDFNTRRIVLKPHEILSVTKNLNIFDFASNYQYKTGKSFEGVTAVSIRAGLYCHTDKKSYYSDGLQIVINPLSKTDKEAFTFIKEGGHDPYQFTSKARITGFGINETIADSVMTKYPQSTFAELASLSLAYQNAKEAKARPELKAKVQLLLEKPLASKYSFVRYLAEELKKSQH